MSQLNLVEKSSAPSTPAAGKVSFYSNNASNPQLSFVDDGGNVRLIQDNAHTIISPAGTTSIPAQTLTSGTLLSSQTAGAIESDGNAHYRTLDTTNGRTQDCNQNIFHLAGNGSAIGATIADYFGANSSLPTVTNGIYELDFYCHFLKSTAGTVTWTITNTQTYTNIVAWWRGTVITGMATTGAVSEAGIVTTTTAAAALPVTGTLSNATNHFYHIHAIAECGTAGNIRLRATESAGTITPLRGSYYTARRLGSSSVGTFVA